MARTNVDAQTAVRGGLAPAFIPAITDGHMFVNNGRRCIRLKNTSASPVVVTARRPNVDGDTVVGKTITVPATTGDVETGFWPAGYNQPDGRVWLDYPSTAGVTVAIVDFEVV